MGSQLEMAKYRLFDPEGLRATNIKLFPGSNRDATPEQAAEAVNKSLAQIETGDFEIIERFDD